MGNAAPFCHFLQLHHTSVDIQYNSTLSAVTSLRPRVCQMKEASLTPPANIPEFRPKEKEPREKKKGGPKFLQLLGRRGVHKGYMRSENVLLIITLCDLFVRKPMPQMINWWF